tara:strand:- start:168 stop:425 length:258 start_codon:yes stop_codon:yes gene_type:complete
MEDKIFDIVTDLIRDDISKEQAIDKLLILHSVSISLLKKYIQHVEDCEGVNFVSDINRWPSEQKFSKEEKALLEKLDKEIEESKC